MIFGERGGMSQSVCRPACDVQPGGKKQKSQKVSSGENEDERQLAVTVEEISCCFAKINKK